MAAVNSLLGCEVSNFVAVKLPVGFYIPIPVSLNCKSRFFCIAEVRKDGGDDPDITHGAIIRAEVSLVKSKRVGSFDQSSGIWLDAGEGVGVVTKPGLPVPPGEPAVNPVPRQMILENVASVILNKVISDFGQDFEEKLPDLPENEPNRRIFLPFPSEVKCLFGIYVVLSIPGGEILAKRTLNPRLGIVEGLSILGTSGLVKPFSHEAYEETIDYALRFARINGCSGVVLATGGKSEFYARKLLSQMPEAAFVQVADFFCFSVKRAEEYGFSEIIHAVFFGKAVKMALGYPYTHAREGLIDMGEVALVAGLSGEVKEAVLGANTARQVLEILKSGNYFHDAIRRICIRALESSFSFSPRVPKRRIMLFDYDGTLLCEESKLV